MIGDKVNSKPHHAKAARQIYDHIKSSLVDKPTFTIAGESGSGKSEIAEELTKLMQADGMKTLILQQDDYFVHPPKTNHNERVEDINWVGTKEVKIGLLDEHLKTFKHDENKVVEKPLVIFDEDRIVTEKVDLSPFDVVVAEGTYTTLLKHGDYHVFIDRDYHDTKPDRQERGREKIDSFSEQIMKIEHQIISKHKALATFVVDKNFDAQFVGK